MTVSNQTVRALYAGPGSGPFPIPFPYVQVDDFDITKRSVAGVASTLVYGVDYLVGAAGTLPTISTAYIMLTVPLVEGETLLILRQTDLTQETAYRNNDAFQASAHEGALDKLTLIAQETREQLGRSLKIVKDHGLGNSVDMTLPPGKAYAYLGWDSTGSAITNYEATPTVLSIPVIDHIANYDDLEDAVATIGASSPHTLLIHQETVLENDLTIPDTLTLWVLRGGMISVNAGVTLTTRIPIAGAYQIFDGAGSVKLKGPGHYLLPQWWGAEGDGVTDCTLAIQAALDNAYRLGGVTVLLNAGVYVTSSPLWLYSGTIIQGAGMDSTMISLADGANCTIVKSGGDPDLRDTTDPLDFDNLTTTGEWLTAPYGMGLKDISLYGNSGNQTSGYGVQLYGKRLYIHNLNIFSCYSGGWYSECGGAAGRLDWHGNPISTINGLIVQDCGGISMHFRGPHDAHIQMACIAGGAQGVRIDEEVSNGANCDIGLIHQYNASGTDPGFYIGKGVGLRAQQIIAESNHGPGLEFDGVESQIGILQLYKNCRTATGTASLIIRGRNSIFDSISLRNFSDLVQPQTGVLVTGYGHTMNLRVQAVENGMDSNCMIGLDIDSQPGRNIITAQIVGCDADGAIGMRTGNTYPVQQSHIKAGIRGCNTNWQNVQGGKLNTYQVYIKGLTAEETLFSGVGPNSLEVKEKWSVVAEDYNNVPYYTERRRVFGTPLDMTSTSVQTRSSLHGLLLTPSVEDVMLGLVMSNDVDTNYRWDIYPTITGITSTTVTVKAKLGTASAAGTCDLVLWAFV